MAIPITIQGTVVLFPSVAESPNWAPAIIAFAQAVESALAGVVGSGDVSPQVQTIDASNPGTNVNINTLSFSTTDVRSAFISYAVFRQTDSTKVYEAGSLNVVYNPSNPVGQKWEKVREYEGDAQITFAISDTGQISFSTAAIAGTSHEGWISFSAKALSQT